MVENKTHLLGISSGAIPIFNLLEDEVVEMDYKLGTKNGRIDSFERSSESKERVLWRDNFYSPQEFLSKAILQNYRAKLPSEVYTDHSLEPARENYRQFVQFKVYGASSLLVIFLSLFANYFYQNHLNTDVAELEQNLMSSNDNLALLERLEQEKTRKEQLISGAGVTSSLFLSYYLDEIGQTVPKGVQLQEMKLFPLDGKIKNKQKVEVNQEQIIIEGTTIGNETLDNWIEKMDRFEWVRSIELLNYHEGEENRAEFKLLINQVN
jgi:Tfp pilus assembly protein PilN